ncbi:cytochrome c3 family protein [Anaeromyxobacter paludicola]|uniref:Doubled CXXCH motif domain-containing protein n=1 Tax=Anaeromyxobacter paludicola TaxID=2918171 RepID=A0ABN6N6B1_9BACT|nr:cytochrome c3 family protein [Anaeromyxobacter paludicola]BDG07363.1 hypothetical protein AMPC_04760 [Anaeromyxobacter paludicola]
MTRRPLLAGTATLLLAATAVALDAPHDASTQTTCTSCHIAHSAQGGALTSQYGNSNLCFSCHSQTGVGTWRNFPWTAQNEAVPGAGGHSHRWDSPATNPLHGAKPPNNAALAAALDQGGVVTCSTCHDQHDGSTTNALGATQHVFSPDAKLQAGSLLTRTAGTGTGTLTLTSVVAATAARSGARPRAYIIRISAGGATGTATYVASYDNGVSWTAAASTASPVTLDSDATGPTVTVTFAGSFVAGDQWKMFTVSNSFLRTSNLNSALCEDCHRDRVQTAACVQGSSGATTGGGDSCDTSSGITYSHPTGPGVTLAQSYDRATGGVPQPLDVNGAVQGSGGADPLATNKLMFDSSNQVRCTTCHGVHNADSNSLTEDPR